MKMESVKRVQVPIKVVAFISHYELRKEYLFSPFSIGKIVAQTVVSRSGKATILGEG